MIQAIIEFMSHFVAGGCMAYGVWGIATVVATDTSVMKEIKQKIWVAQVSICIFAAGFAAEMMML